MATPTTATTIMRARIEMRGRFQPSLAKCIGFAPLVFDMASNGRDSG